MNVGFVFVDNNLVCGSFDNQSPNLGQALTLLSLGEGTYDDGFGVATVCTEPTKNTPHDTDADSNVDKFLVMRISNSRVPVGRELPWSNGEPSRK
jgi:hypothetical protein